MSRRSLILIPLLILAAVIGLRLAFPQAVTESQLKVFDTFQRLKPRTYQAAPVCIVDIDDESLARLGQWPWPRTQMAQLIERLHDLGAAAIVFDIVFAEPDRTSPANILPVWENTSNLKEVRPFLEKIPDHDQVFAQALSKAPVVTGFSLEHKENNFRPVLKAGFAYAGDNPLQYLPKFKGAVINLPALEKVAAGNGSFNMLAERDGIIRRVPLLFRYQDSLYPSLAAEALRVAQGASSYIVKTAGGSGETSFGEHTGIVNVKIGNLVVPTDAQGRLWLYDTGPISQRIVPAWQILSEPLTLPSPLKGEGNPIKDKIVFIGASASGLKDIRTTPINPVAAGTEIHAQLTEQILLQEFLLRPDWAAGAEMLYLVTVGLALIFLMTRLSAAWCALIGGTSILAVFAVSWYLFAHTGRLLDPVLPSLVALVLYLGVSLISYLRTETERRQVRHAFSQYMSPVLVEQLAQNPKQLKLGGEMKNMTLLFTDIRDFTTIAEQLDAQGLTRFMNQYFTPMTDIILKQQGTIDKYIGDCIMAFWNAPLDDPSHARHACQAALEMQQYLKSWNTQATIPIRVGIGINTGNCCVGNMGSDKHFNYTVLGDDVNLASRIEGLSKIYGVDIVIGENTYREAGNFAALEIDQIKVKGKNKSVKIFALLADERLKQSETFLSLSKFHGEMLEAYRKQNWTDAKDLIQKCLEAKVPGLDLAAFYTLYTSRIESHVINPPDANWDGVTVATSK